MFFSFTSFFPSRLFLPFFLSRLFSFASFFHLHLFFIHIFFSFASFFHSHLFSTYRKDPDRPDSCASHSESLISLSFLTPAFSANSFGFFILTFLVNWFISTSLPQRCIHFSSNDSWIKASHIWQTNSGL